MEKIIRKADLHRSSTGILCQSILSTVNYQYIEPCLCQILAFFVKKKPTVTTLSTIFRYIGMTAILLVAFDHLQAQNPSWSCSWSEVEFRELCIQGIVFGKINLGIWSFCGMKCGAARTLPNTSWVITSVSVANKEGCRVSPVNGPPAAILLSREHDQLRFSRPKYRGWSLATLGTSATMKLGRFPCPGN